MGKLDGKVAVVTGASRGIGRDIARVFAREGAKVVVSARTDKEGDFRIPGSIQTTVQRIHDEGGEAIGIRCDVADEAQVEALFTQTVEHYGRVDILVNNAAIMTPGFKVEDLQIRHWDLLYRVNIRGPFVCCKFALPIMKRQGHGHIINVTSRLAQSPGPGPYTTVASGNVNYDAGKAHLDRFTQGLAREVWQDGIGVNGLWPMKGVASEGMLWSRGAPGSNRGSPGSRATGEAMGDAGVYICTQDPRTYTGHIIGDDDALRAAGVTDFSKYPLVTA